MSRFRQVATVERGGLSTSWHHGAAAVVTPEGRLVARVGSETVETYLRSAAKPFQALPLVEAEGVERWSLSKADLALICSSHQGTPAHTTRVEALLSRADLPVSELRCGAHWPFDVESCRRLRAAGLEPSSLHNNCSGKHAGLLLACRILGDPLDSYLDPDHPLERRILESLALCCRLDVSDIGVGVDGCGMPCFRMSLEAASRGFAALADPSAAALPEPVALALGRIADAMTDSPEMVSGPGTFTTRLMEVTAGRVLGKEGAGGLYGVAVRGPVALGLVVKIADGADRARPGVVLDLLRQLGSLSAAELGQLSDFHRPKLVNARGEEVGQIVPGPELEETEAT